MSSKNKRKEERKKIDLKQGGFYEDIAIIRVLHMMYNEVFDFGCEIKEICLICHYNNLNVARKLHNRLGELQYLMIRRIPEIWSDVFVNEEDQNEFVVAAVIQNKQDLGRLLIVIYTVFFLIIALSDPQYRAPPSIQKAESWKLEIFS